MIKVKENNMKTAITVGTKVWGPKRSYLGTVKSLKNAGFGVVFATIGWGGNVGLYREAVENIDSLEVRK